MRQLIDMLLLATPAVLQRYKISRRLNIGDKKAQYNIMGRRQWLQNICI